MSRRICILGIKDKGGVGLTTTLAAIITLLRATANGATGDDAFAVHAIDSDGFNQTLTQRLAERDAGGMVLPVQNPLRGVEKADLFARDGAAPIFEAIESSARVVAIDTPAGGLTQIDQMSENLSAVDLVAHCHASQRSLLVVVPFNASVAAIRGVGNALGRFGDGAQLIAVRARAGVRDDDYRLWSTEPLTDRYGRSVGGQVRRRFEAAGGRVIDNPALAAGSGALSEALTLTFAEAATYRGPDWPIVARLNVVNWLNAWVRELRKVGDLLGIDDGQWRTF